jgi:uncharacterized protein (DUF934 family)
MAQIILDKTIVNDDWVIVPKDTTEVPAEGKCILPFGLMMAHLELLDSDREIGVWLDSDEEPESLTPYLKKLAVIAINFPKFADGRGYSYARSIREHDGYQGQLRAIGDVLKDQLFYMQRCGFNAFQIREDRDINEALSSLNDFSNSYQAATDQKTPLFRRR